MTSSTYVLPRYPMTKHLHAALPGALGIPVGLAGVPKVEDDAGGLVLASAPYAILWPLWRNLSGPPLGAAHADAEWVYQVSLYGRRGDQVDLLQDKVFDYFLGKTNGVWNHEIAVPGLSVMDRIFKEDQGADPAEGTTGTLETVARFGLLVTPAS